MTETCYGCLNKIASQRKTHGPRHFLYLKETKSWWCEEGGGGGEGGEEEKVQCNATERGMGKNRSKILRV